MAIQHRAGAPLLRLGWFPDPPGSAASLFPTLLPRQELTVAPQELWSVHVIGRPGFGKSVFLGNLALQFHAAVVVPDNVLFASQAGDVFKVLMEDCDVHTVLRNTRGTFSPYTEGTKTNVIFFTKGRPTEQTWIYDARANVPKLTKKSRPLRATQFDEFERCYGNDPSGRSKRSESASPEGRWRSFSIEDIKAKHYKLDAFKWLRDEELDDPNELPEPEELITEAMEMLQLALNDLADVQRLLEGNGVAA